MSDTTEQDRIAICGFIARKHVLGLAVASDGDIWTASCFYAFEADAMELLLMTDPATRHGRLMTANPKVAGTIAGQPNVVGRIQGVQFSALARVLEGTEAVAGRHRYLRRFPAAVLAPSAPLWALRLQEVKMTDNLLSFGTKRLWLAGPATSAPAVS